MRQTIVAILSALALLVTGACADTEGTTYEAPVEKVYEKLAALDMGADIGSAVFMYHDTSLPTSTEANKSVSWHMGGKQGSDVVAHLTPVNATQTKVVIDVIPSPALQAMPVPAQNFAKNMIRERIAAHLEERKFDDDKFMDVFYGGKNSLFPKEIREAGMEAQRQYAQSQRMADEMRKDGGASVVHSQEPVKWGEPVTAQPTGLR